MVTKKDGRKSTQPNVLDIVKEVVFSRSSTIEKVKIEDFEFKESIRRAGPGKIYLAKLPDTGMFYDVLSMRKDKLI